MKEKIKFIEDNWGNEIIFYFNDSTCEWEVYIGGAHILDLNPQLRTEKITGLSFNEMLNNVIKSIKQNENN